MNYIEVSVKIPDNRKELSEILVAFLAEQGFESFSEENSILYSYIVEEDFNQQELKSLMSEYDIDYSLKIIPQQNWNEEWEKNFEPIIIEKELAIKAPFHSENFDTGYIIEIEPKMSFGTGHHATTYMMCKLISDFDFTGKKVLDMGCGTGILGIYASMKGAKDITAIDIDEWAYENSVENAERNNIKNFETIKGDVNSIPDKKYDFIFANINLNILKKDIPTYSRYMNTGSHLFLSGFFNSELPQITEICKANNLEYIKSIEKESWNASIFRKV